MNKRSLFMRLLFGFGAVMLAIWLAVLVWNVFEVKAVEQRINAALLKSVARQIMAGLEPIADKPLQVHAAITKIERLQNDFFEEIGPSGAPFQVQVWHRHAIVHASTNLPLVEPQAGELSRPVTLHGWLSWSESESGTTVRVLQKSFYGLAMTRSNIGYYLLPVLFSFPFLLLPAWFVIRRGLRPVTVIVSEIEARSAADLSPLAASPYKELSPLVASVNRLMERLRERLEREQEFLLDAAHELKTPLAIIQINADSLVATRDERRIAQAGAGLGQGVARATHTVHQLLALARSGSERDLAELQRLDLAELLRERMAPAAQLALQGGVELELNAPEACLLALHRESVTALVDNLIDNAIKYSPRGGQVAVSLVSGADGTVLRVCDQGPGIAPQARQKVFERFFRLPGQDQAGSGLGLAIAQRAAARNLAQIGLDGGPDGRGLLVSVTFTPP